MYANTFLTTFGSYILRPILPLYAASVGASIVQIGFIVAAQGIIPVLTATHLGWFSDKYGRKLFLLLGPLLLGVSALGMGLSPLVLALLAWNFVGGLGQAMWEPAAKTSVADFAPSGTLGKAYGTFAIFMQLGFSLGPAAGSVLAKYAGYQLTFLLSAALLGLASALSAGLSRRARTNEAVERVKLTVGLKGAARDARVRMGWSSILVTSLVFTTIVSFTPLYAVSIGVDPLYVGFLLTAQAVANAVARIPIGFMMDRRKAITGPVVASLVISGLSVVLMGYLTNFELLLLPMVLIGFASATVNVGSNVLVAEGTTKANRGIAQGVVTALRNGATTIGPSFLGVAVMLSGYAQGFAEFGVITVIGAGLTWLVGKRAGAGKSDRGSMESEPARAKER